MARSRTFNPARSLAAALVAAAGVAGVSAVAVAPTPIVAAAPAAVADGPSDLIGFNSTHTLMAAENRTSPSYTMPTIAQDVATVEKSGDGIDVALIDTGVSPVHGIAGNLIQGPDLTPSAPTDKAHLDENGHGTHMAGIIAGNDEAKLDKESSFAPDDTSSAGFRGIAPRARVVSVKVADAEGRTTLAAVLAGIDWVIEHRHDNGMNIRVLNLSFGVDTFGEYQKEILAVAVERAWNAGIVVVAAAGNDGADDGFLELPAVDPYLIAVGATESYSPKGAADDVVTDWSNRGDGVRNPDVVAPGKSVVSLRVPGSTADVNYPNAVEGERFMRASGTSQSTAVVSGGVASILSNHPHLTPDQVKQVITGTAASLRTPPAAQGNGRVHFAPDAVKKAAELATKRPLVQTHPEAHGEGGNADTDPDASGATWSGGEWNGATWSGGEWSGATWSGATWSGATWSGATWSGATWSGATWSGATWSSNAAEEG